MTIEDLKSKGLILLECISGSRAYGLATPQSDTDIKGVFLLPKEDFYGLKYVQQVSNETNDIVYYELGRFLELLSVNNPNILELLNTPKEAILYRNPILSQLKSEKILSKKCLNTFGKFALSQIKKAKGLKKKIVNPMEKERKGVVPFCYVNYENGAIPLLKFLELKGWTEKNCGLVNISNMKDVFGLYYDAKSDFKGIVKNEYSNEVLLSSIPKGIKQEALLYFNKDGYSSYCKDYREYWDWVEKRNDVRYENTLNHGNSYDSKNMMHTFRLLEMAIEIAQENQINVKRENRGFLLGIKSGAYQYEELLEMAKLRQIEMEAAFENSTLPDSPDIDYIEKMAFQLRNELYLQNSQ